MSETQQDQDFIVSEAIGKTENFINQNKKSLGIIFGAVLVAIGGYIFYQNVYVANKEKEAQEVLFHAEQYLFADSLKLAINGDGKNPGLEEIVNDYSVSQSGNLARYYLGMAYLKNKEFDKAIETLKSYDTKDKITDSLVADAIDDAYIELKNVNKAISFYEKASKDHPNAFSTPIMLMKLGIAQETKGNWDGAKSAYEQIKKDYPTSNEGTQADKYIARAEAMMAK